ncbi:hypothetical protein DL96DRAFT_1598366 [Flagelloscypha sp. PMI_526]|nr:hypothetical protein DL96DRAFT_1598366 [Flagelloscypha sp. PMI_526]
MQTARELLRRNSVSSQAERETVSCDLSRLRQRTLVARRSIHEKRPVLDKLAEGGSLESLVQFGEASVKETSGLSLRRWFWMKTSLVLKRDGLYLSSGINSETRINLGNIVRFERLQMDNGRTFLLAFPTDEALYGWYDVIYPMLSGKPGLPWGFAHEVNLSLRLPKEWEKYLQPFLELDEPSSPGDAPKQLPDTYIINLFGVIWTSERRNRASSQAARDFNDAWTAIQGSPEFRETPSVIPSAESLRTLIDELRAERRKEFLACAEMQP